MEMNFSSRFAGDPLGFLDEQLARVQPLAAVGAHRYVVNDPLVARAVLRNAQGQYRDHSDFFHTDRGAFGPRACQLAIRRSARRLLRAHLQASGQPGLDAHLDAHLPALSHWPDAGNRLAYRCLKSFLLAPDAPPHLSALLDEVVERSVLAGAKQGQPHWRRMWLRFRVDWRLAGALEERRRLARAEPVDILDVIAAAATPAHRPEELVEVFLSFLFAVAGSVGFVLGWSVYLMGTHPKRDVPAQWIVQEALRLWPVAWLLNRNPAQPHALGGVAVDERDDVVVCPYSVQRHAEYWPEPAAYRPERWADADSWRNPAFIAFGYGPHRCVAADLASTLVADILGSLIDRYSPVVEARGTAPTIAAAMAPPPFTLTLEHRSATPAASRGTNRGDKPASPTRCRQECPGVGTTRPAAGVVSR